MKHNGVPVNMLHCPTCRARFDLTVRKDDDSDFTMSMPDASTLSVIPAGPNYLVCRNGHRWTIKTIWRNLDADVPDEVLLMDYIGLDPT